jgi:hypothetical protein
VEKGKSGLILIGDLPRVSHVTRATSVGDFFVCVDLLSLESPPSIYLRATRKPGCTGLVRDSRVRDWLWLGKVLAPLTHPT